MQITLPKDSPISSPEDSFSRLRSIQSCNGINQFPFKLHDMLLAAEQEGFTSVVSWLPMQDAFRVHITDEFAEKILPRFFNQSKYKSFQKQLNVWGFVRITKGPDRGGYKHTLFVRGKKALCTQMSRRKTTHPLPTSIRLPQSALKAPKENATNAPSMSLRPEQLALKPTKPTAPRPIKMHHVALFSPNPLRRPPPLLSLENKTQLKRKTVEREDDVDELDIIFCEIFQ